MSESKQLKAGEWFMEVNKQWPGQAMALLVEEVLHDAKSDYQHVQCFKSKAFGNVLVLDGVIQITEKDECAYQEMISHLPMFSHPNPEQVLIVGGGDGGCIREVLKHKSVKQVTICEIDKMVIETSKKYLPGIAQAWGDERVSLICGDAVEYMKKEENKGKFDVIVCDSSDPVGPAEKLFEAEFYKDMYDALKPGGKACTQAECVWIHMDLIKKLVQNARKLYANAEYAVTQIPTYPNGTIGLLLCSKASEEKKEAPSARGRKKRRKEAAKPTCTAPVRTVPKDMEATLKYYTPRLHSSAFVLPAFAERVLETAEVVDETEKKEMQE